jgi:hypothetical protein
MPSMFTLFDILALLYVFRGAQLLITIWRQWPEFKSEPLTAQKKTLANQASFFIAVPLSVLIHELAHAVAVIMAGGEILDFHYRAFYGYVEHVGNYTAAQLWWIALVGTLGSLAFGLVLWFFLRSVRSSSIRYFALRALRYQIYFSLIFYPLFTLFGFDGDWRIIYDFTSTPILSVVTAVFHVSILYAFWRFDRQGWFEAPAFTDVAGQEHFAELSAGAAANPQDIALQLQVIDTLRRGGAPEKAKHQLNRVIIDHPESSLAILESAALKSSGKGSVPAAAAEDAQKALDLGLASPSQEMFAYDLLGRYQSERGQLDPALQSLSAALDLAVMSGSSAASIDLLIRRSQIYRRQKNYTLAYQDLQQALTLGQRTGSEQLLQHVNQEIEVLARHSGQSYLAAPAEHFE